MNKNRKNKYFRNNIQHFEDIHYKKTSYTFNFIIKETFEVVWYLLQVKEKTKMDFSRSSLLPVQAPEFNPDIRGVSPKATMNVQTSSPIGMLFLVKSLDLYHLNVRINWNLIRYQLSSFFSFF